MKKIVKYLYLISAFCFFGSISLYGQNKELTPQEKLAQVKEFVVYLYDSTAYVMQKYNPDGAPNPIPSGSVVFPAIIAEEYVNVTLDNISSGNISPQLAAFLQNVRKGNNTADNGGGNGNSGSNGNGNSGGANTRQSIKKK